MPVHHARILPAAALILGLSAMAAVAGFSHPGIRNNKAELDFIRGRVQAKAEPWNTAAARLEADSRSSLSYAPKPRAVVDCGSYSNPDNGCSDEMRDAQAAYAHALLWYLKGDAAHARKAAEILNAWSVLLEDHTNSNAFLQAGWAGSVFPLAAEILRASYPGWTAVEQDRFSTMLKTAFLAKIRNGPPSPGFNGNWHLTIIEAIVAISVFTDDTASFRKGVSMWRSAVPAYFYMASDGPLPVRPAGTTQFDAPAAIRKYWYDQDSLANGESQETCRDLEHTQYGIAASASVAEIAYHQGLDLYAENADRITAAMEFHANLLLGAPAPAWLCGGALSLVNADPTWEVAYNHFHNRLKRNLPLSSRLITEKVRPSKASLHMVWETMTHAELGSPGGSIGIRPGEGLGEKAAPGAAARLRWYRNGYLADRWTGAGLSAFSLDGSRMQPGPTGPQTR
jgi:hypothetical protein